MSGYADFRPARVDGSEVSAKPTFPAARRFPPQSACPRCPERGVATAPMVPAIIEKVLASVRVVVDAVVAKCCGRGPLTPDAAI